MKRQGLMIGILAVVWALSTEGTLQAALMNLTTTEDVYISSAEPDKNFNTSTNHTNTQLFTNHYHTLQFILLKFDLSALPDDATIQSINLNLCGLSTSNSYAYFNRAEDDSWDEDTVTWNSHSPSMQEDDLSLRYERGIEVTGSGGKTWFQMPLAGDFSDDLADGTLTLLISCGDVTYFYSQGISFASKEYTDAGGGGDYDPYLQINYIPEPATLILLAAGSLACLKRRS